MALDGPSTVSSPAWATHGEHGTCHDFSASLESRLSTKHQFLKHPEAPEVTKTSGMIAVSYLQINGLMEILLSCSISIYFPSKAILQTIEYGGFATYGFV